MTSDKFRHQLRHEAQLWQTEGIIDASQYEHLAQRYQFNTLDTTARNSFISILLGLGSNLIGLGIITFVAANWQELSRNSKVVLLLSLFIGVNIAGFYLWKQPKESQQRLGQGLLLLGALILGANMGLMGQIFHIDAPFYELLLAWSIGVLAMAYSLRLASLGILSIILIWLGYWGYWGSFITQSTLPIEWSWSSLLGQHIPIVIALLFIPLAYWCDSGWIFALSAIAIISALGANLQPFMWSESYGWVASIAFALPTALLWSYDDSAWVHGLPKQRFTSYQPIARGLALFGLGILLLFASTGDFWRFLVPNNPIEVSQNWFLLIDPILFTGVAIWQWANLKRQPRHRRDKITIAIALLIGIIAVIPLWHISIAQITPLATVTFNVLLFLFAAGLIRTGLSQGDRRIFWGGMTLLTLRIFYLFVLTATGLLFKSFVFIICGIGVMGVGLWFERRLRNHHIVK